MSHSVCRRLWTDVSGQSIGLAWPLKMGCKVIHWNENNAVQRTIIIHPLFHVTVPPPGRTATQQAGDSSTTTEHARRWTDWLTGWLADWLTNRLRTDGLKMCALPRTKKSHCHPIISTYTIDSLKLSTVTIYWWSFGEMLTLHVKHADFR